MQRNLNDMITLPNLVSCFRLAMAPVLLFFGWYGHPRLFLASFFACVLSDALDGFIARRINQVSEFGAKLDSWGDFVTYSTVCICSWWLWPSVLQREAPFVLAFLFSYFTPILIGFVKFGKLINFHTVAVKISAVFMSGSVLLLFAGGPGWPFRVATSIFILASVEQMVIIGLLRRHQSNVSSLWKAMNLRRTGKLR